MESLVVERAVEIVGAGAGVTFLDGASAQRVVKVTPSGLLTLRGATIQHGRASYGGGILVEGTLTLLDAWITESTASPDAGGGMFVAPGASATIVRSRVATNVAADEGGGIAVEEGELTIAESTLDDNKSGREGGGALWIDGAATVLNSTISGNRASSIGGAGGVQLADGTLSIAQSTITRNRGGAVDGVLQESGDLALFASILDDNSAVDCGGAIRSLGYNIVEHTGSCPFLATGDRVGVDANLALLGEQGGTTPTHLPRITSAAIDIAPASLCSPRDQRGFARTGPCDAGAVDVSICLGRYVTIAGTPGDDQLLGTAGDDVIRGYEGSDTILAGRGADMVCGEAGDDLISAGDGPDAVDAGEGADRVTGGPGNDHLLGGLGNDRIGGGGDRDQIHGGRGDDVLGGGLASDRLYGQEGHDLLRGNRHGDRLRGGPGNDRLNGGRGRDDCRGGQGWRDHRVSCESRGSPH
jgi:Ca2+-binding RTX toxin-like protein